MITRPVRRRSGVILVVVGALVVIIAIGAFMFRQATLQQYLDAHRLTFSQIAMYLAESGLNASLERFRESTSRPGTEFYELLLTRPYAQLNGARVEVSSPFLDQVVEILGVEATIAIEVALDGFRPLHPPQGLRGFQADPREKFGEVKLVSTGCYRGVCRKIVASRQVRVVSVTAPVVSKFTLFVHEKGDQKVNTLAYRRLAPQDGFTYEGEAASPLVLYHRTEQVPGLDQGRFLPLADVLAETDPDQGGLVYLGGDDPWFLNLVHGVGAGVYEELFQLRRARYLYDSQLGGVTKEVGMTFGIYEGILDSPKFFSVRKPRNYPRAGGRNEDVSDRTAALHLYGDVFNVQPTVVLGPVFRSYVDVRLLDGLWYPYMTREEFNAREDKQLFGGRYEVYSQVMVRVRDEAYNRSYDYIASNVEELMSGGTVDGKDTPFVPGPILLERGLLRVQPAVPGDNGFLYPQPEQQNSGQCRLVRLAPGGGETLFQGALADIDGAFMEQILMAKAVYTVPDQQAFKARYLAGTELTVPGVVFIESGDLELPDLNVTQGAMVVVAGNVEVTGRIVQSQPKHPLTVVSLNGDIQIRTGEKIDVALVALRGGISSRGRLNLVGALAAERLDLASLVRGPEEKRITYNQDLDPTDSETYFHHLRVVLDEDVRMYLEAN